MNITLKQSEIEAAVRQYVTGQGISIVGKTLTSIKFVTTRSPFTVGAELVLEDASAAPAADIPGFTDRSANDGLQLVTNDNGLVTGTGFSAPPQGSLIYSKDVGAGEAKVATEATPVPGTIGAAIASVVETTKAADDAATLVAAASTTDPIEQEKSVPEEVAQAAEAPAEDPAPVAETVAAPATTNSLFG